MQTSLTNGQTRTLDRFVAARLAMTQITNQTPH